MQYALCALPIQSGKSEAARAFLHTLQQLRQAAYAESERRLGITKEV